MIKQFVYILLLCHSFILISQEEKSYSISGYAYIKIGNDLFPSNNLALKLNPGNIYTETDSLGFFKFNNLRNNTYQLKYVYDGSRNNKFEVIVKDKSIDNFKIVYDSNCQFSKQKALEDIKNNSIKLLVIGGYAPVKYVTDKFQEKKFNFKYYIFGCLIENPQCIIQYNKTIFRFLDKKYGKQWRQEVRDDITFLNGSNF